MTAFTYSQWLTHMVTIMQNADPDGQAAFAALAPYFIDRAERLIYSDPDLDFLATRDTDTTQLTTRGSRAVPIPAQMITVEGLNIITPANTLPSLLGAQRIPYQRTSRQHIDFVWPTESTVQAPDTFFAGYFAIFDFDQGEPAPGEDEPSPLPSSFLLAPTPDDAYRVEVTGTFRPPALSASNPESFLSTYYYPLFLAATLVAGFGYQQNFGAQSDNPQTAMSWQQEYKYQRDMVVAESKRQKASVDGYSPVQLSAMPSAPSLPMGAPPGVLR